VGFLRRPGRPTGVPIRSAMLSAIQTECPNASTPPSCIPHRHHRRHRGYVQLHILTPTTMTQSQRPFSHRGRGVAIMGCRRDKPSGVNRVVDAKEPHCCLDRTKFDYREEADAHLRTASTCNINFEFLF
jgi:hypothetical protein